MASNVIAVRGPHGDDDALAPTGLYTKRAAARHLNISVHKLDKLIAAGRIHLADWGSTRPRIWGHELRRYAGLPNDNDPPTNP